MRHVDYDRQGNRNLCRGKGKLLPVQSLQSLYSTRAVIETAVAS